MDKIKIRHLADIKIKKYSYRDIADNNVLTDKRK